MDKRTTVYVYSWETEGAGGYEWRPSAYKLALDLVTRAKLCEIDENALKITYLGQLEVHTDTSIATISEQVDKFFARRYFGGRL